MDPPKDTTDVVVEMLDYNCGMEICGAGERRSGSPTMMLPVIPFSPIKSSERMEDEDWREYTAGLVDIEKWLAKPQEKSQINGAFQDFARGFFNRQVYFDLWQYYGKALTVGEYLSHCKNYVWDRLTPFQKGQIVDLDGPEFSSMPMQTFAFFDPIDSHYVYVDPQTFWN